MPRTLALPASYCAACLAPAHADCFATAGRCGILGCGEATVVRARHTGSRRRRAAWALGLLLISSTPVVFFRSLQAAASLGAGATLVRAELQRHACFTAVRRVRRLLEWAEALLEEAGAETPRRPTVLPRIEGTVVAVSESWSPPPVLIAVGSTQGVCRDMQLAVYRGKTFIGKVLIERVRPESASATVLFTVEGVTIEPGDRAVTRID